MVHRKVMYNKPFVEEKWGCFLLQLYVETIVAGCYNVHVTPHSCKKWRSARQIKTDKKRNQVLKRGVSASGFCVRKSNMFYKPSLFLTKWHNYFAVLY